MTKVALVTGSSRGIGKGIALSLIKSGYEVYINGKKLERKQFPYAWIYQERKK